MQVLQALGISSSRIAARGLEPYAEADRLEVAELGEDGTLHLLIPEAAASWARMRRAAHTEGISLFIVSAYRSIDRQAEIVRRKLESGQKIEDILCVSAPPGFSEHHTGRAVDLGTVGTPALTVEFESTPAFVWLQRHAESFRFKLSYPLGNAHGYDYEPWHWCYAAERER